VKFGDLLTTGRVRLVLVYSFSGQLKKQQIFYKLTVF